MRRLSQNDRLDISERLSLVSAERYFRIAELRKRHDDDEVLTPEETDELFGSDHWNIENEDDKRSFIATELYRLRHERYKTAEMERKERRKEMRWTMVGLKKIMSDSVFLLGMLGNEARSLFFSRWFEDPFGMKWVFEDKLKTKAQVSCPCCEVDPELPLFVVTSTSPRSVGWEVVLDIVPSALVPDALISVRVIDTEALFNTSGSGKKYQSGIADRKRPIIRAVRFHEACSARTKLLAIFAIRESSNVAFGNMLFNSRSTILSSCGIWCGSDQENTREKWAQRAKEIADAEMEEANRRREAQCSEASW